LHARIRAAGNGRIWYFEYLPISNAARRHRNGELYGEENKIRERENEKIGGRRYKYRKNFNSEKKATRRTPLLAS